MVAVARARGAPQTAALTSLPPTVRILGEITILVLGIAAVLVISRGLVPVAPAMAGALRALLHPVVLVLVVALFLLFRVGRGRSRKSAPDDPVEADRSDPRL